MSQKRMGRIASYGAVAVTLLAGLALGRLGAAQTPPEGRSVPVRLSASPDGRWTLLRGGAPYWIQGAGGSDSLELLKASGGNSIRTWGADKAAADLDKAHRLGLTVTLGFWLGHKEHGFRYDDPKAVADQRAKIRQIAERVKDHPALLFWAVGNEMEADGKDPNVWKAVEEIAADLKRLDPNHPTMTVIADIGEGGVKVKQIAALCPSIDVIGINSYGGLSSLPKRLKEVGSTKPYVVTEFGPNGPWEVGKTAWGAPLEATSTEKAKQYAERYESAVAGQKGWCLGSYVFLWGNKVEGTPTWFGMFLPGTNDRLGPVDAMTRAWTGKGPANPVPVLQRAESSAARKEVTPGSAQTVTVTASGSGTLNVSYEIRPEMQDHEKHEPGQQAPAAVKGVVPPAGPLRSGAAQTFTAPTQEGPYRLYVTLRDGSGGAATANLPFFVKAPPATR